MRSLVSDQGVPEFRVLLRRERIAARVTQEELARNAGISVRAVQSLERGDRRPQRETTNRLRSALGLEGVAEATFLVAARPAPRLEAATTPVSNNLPLPTSSFIGRHDEVADVLDALVSTRLLTVTGIGGCGKTRLALEVARALLAAPAAELVRDGVWLIELDALADPSLVAWAVARTFGLREKPSEPLVTTLARTLRQRCLVLVLDNCEHVRAACAELVDRLLRECPNLRVLATSRHALTLPGEVVYRLKPLTAPPEDAPPEALACYPASRLFLDRAAGAASRSRVTPSVAAVARICRQLDGLPLALELAAMRVPGLGLQQIAERLDRRFQLLTAGSPAAPPRHQTLRATIAWSYDLLDEPEKVVFRRLAVFAGGWTLEAAEAVCGDDVLPLLLALVDQCLVIADVQPDGSARYCFLDTLRAFAREQLVACLEADAIRERHAAYFATLADDDGRALDSGPSDARWLDRVEADWENLLAALRWVVEQHDAERGWRLGAPLAMASIWRGYSCSARLQLAQLIALPRGMCSPAIQARALECEAELAFHQADYALSAARHAEHVELCRCLGEPRRLLAGLCELAHALRDQGDAAGARACLEESLAIAGEIGDRRRMAVTLDLLGTVAHAQGDTSTAHARFCESLQIASEIQDPLLLAWTPFNLACLALDAGNLSQARRSLQESLAIWQSRRATDGILHALAALASLAAAEHRPDEAVRLAAATTRLSAISGCTLAPIYRGRFERVLAGARACLGDERADRIWAEAQTMTQEQAVAAAQALARQADPVAPIPASSEKTSDGLTARELQVLHLLTTGKTNREIAAELVLSTKTVMHHSVSIYRKLGVRGRAQATAYAVAHGLAGPLAPDTDF